MISAPVSGGLFGPWNDHYSVKWRNKLSYNKLTFFPGFQLLSFIWFNNSCRDRNTMICWVSRRWLTHVSAHTINKRRIWNRLLPKLVVIKPVVDSEIYIDCIDMSEHLQLNMLQASHPPAKQHLNRGHISHKVGLVYFHPSNCRDSHHQCQSIYPAVNIVLNHLAYLLSVSPLFVSRL
jgi:hypothetical protein